MPILDTLKRYSVAILTALASILAAIFFLRRSSSTHEQSATSAGAAAAEHEEMADLALEQAKSEVKAAESLHVDAEQAATVREEKPVTEVVKRAKRGWKA